MVKSTRVLYKCDECNYETFIKGDMIEINEKDICKHCKEYMITCTRCKEFKKGHHNKCNICKMNVCETCAKDMKEPEMYSNICGVCDRYICKSCTYITFSQYDDENTCDVIVAICFSCIKDSPNYSKLINYNTS